MYISNHNSGGVITECCLIFWPEENSSLKKILSLVACNRLLHGVLVADEM